MGSPWDWRIDEIERNAKEGARAASRLHELESLRSDVGRLECANRELCSCVDGLRATAEACLSRIEELERRLNEVDA